MVPTSKALHHLGAATTQAGMTLCRQQRPVASLWVNKLTRAGCLA